MGEVSTLPVPTSGLVRTREKRSTAKALFAATAPLTALAGTDEAGTRARSDLATGTGGWPAAGLEPPCEPPQPASARRKGEAAKRKERVFMVGPQSMTCAIRRAKRRSGPGEAWKSWTRHPCHGWHDRGTSVGRAGVTSPRIGPPTSPGRQHDESRPSIVCAFATLRL